MSAALTSGVGVTFRTNGKSLTFSPLSGEIRGAFERWLQELAWGNIDRVAATSTPDRVARLEANLVNDITAGKYEWDEPLAQEKRNKKSGFMYHVWLRLLKAHPNLKLEDVEPIVLGMEIKNQNGETVVSPYQRIHALFRVADGWEPDPKILSALVEGSEAEAEAKSALATLFQPS